MIDELKQWEYDRGYEKGKTDVLNKIRAEIEVLNPVDYVSMSSYEGHRGASDMKDDVLQIIDKHIALEQEPKTGHWDSRICKCSECGYQIAFSEYAERKYKYCPNCGARMESEE